MKIINNKNIRIFFVAFILIATTFLVKLKAIDNFQTSSDITIKGAQIRTLDPNGLAFVGEVTNSEQFGTNINYGIILSRGEVLETDYDDFLVGSTMNGYLTINAFVDSLDDENFFRITLINIPEIYYNLKFSARAYVMLNNGSYIYSSQIQTRSFYQVAKAFLDKGNESELIQDICKTRVNYALNGGSWNDTSINKYYEEFANITTDFLNDYNEYATSVSKPIYTKSQFGSLDTTGIPEYTLTDFLYSSTYKTKWIWLVNYFAINANANNITAFQAFNNYTSSTSLNAANQNFIKQINYEFRGFISESLYGSATPYQSADYSSVNPQTQILNYNNDNQKRLFTYENALLNLDAPKKDYYNFVGWYNNPSFTGEAITNIDINLGVIPLYAQYAPINYTIIYVTNDGEFSSSPITNFNVEDEEIILPTNISLANATFQGWYLNNSFSGDIVTSVAAGTSCNLTLYAKWEMDAKPINVQSSGGASISYNTFNEFTMASGDIITVAAGTYNENLTIPAAATNISLLGPNKDVLGTSINRTDEAIFTGIITINATYCTINGISTFGSAQIKTTKSNTVLTCLKMISNIKVDMISVAATLAISNITISNSSIITTSNANAIVITGTSSAKVSNITITDNYIKGLITETTDIETCAIKANYTNNSVSIINNNIVGFGKYPININNPTTSSINITNNSFVSGGIIGGHIIIIQTSTTNTACIISYNTFTTSKCDNSTDTSDGSIINVRGAVGTDKYSIIYNKFMDAGSLAKTIYLSFGVSSASSAAFIVDSNYFAIAPTTTNVKTTLEITNTYSSSNDVPTYSPS